MARVMFIFIFALAVYAKAEQGLFLKITADVSQSSVYTAEGYFLGYTPISLPLPKTPRIFVIKNKFTPIEYTRMSPEPKEKDVEWNISFSGVVNRENVNASEAEANNEVADNSESIKTLTNSSDYYFNISILGQNDDLTLQTKTFIEDKFLVHFTTCNLAQRIFVIGPTSKFIINDIKSWAVNSKIKLNVARAEKRTCDSTVQMPVEKTVVVKKTEVKAVEPEVIEEVREEAKVEVKTETQWDSAEELLAKLPPLNKPEPKIKSKVSTAFGEQTTYSGIYVQIFANPTAGNIGKIEATNYKKCDFVKNGARWVRFYYEFESMDEARTFLKSGKRLPASDSFVRTEMTCLKN